ncbi:ParB/RepB/Spo0J family partition protein [Massilia aerilata]|uniref:ParB/RepB/Spo0J family partition protein n=1 Tax=Massilia aerilata TaxID=453817 RepID=A0ABW0S465_9BURK
MTLPPPLSAHDLAIVDAQVQHTFDDGHYGHFEIAKLRASPDNRKRFNEQALQELAESIKTMGVAQAILIRPVTPTEDAPQEFEIVAGERRFRASKIAGKTHIPALCRKLSDLDAAKIRILENLQREDPHPMEEAEGYQLLMLQHGFTADQVAYEVNRSRSYIYGRLKLCALGLEVRELFLDNKLSASTALLVARIPSWQLQAKAAQEILNPPYSSEPMSYRQAVTHVQQRYMLDLDTAVFSLTDAKLLAAAGACTKCPKRAGNQPEVFEGVNPDVCTDPDCFAEKKAAHYNATITAANKKGIPVHEASEAHAMASKAWDRNSELVHADVHLSYFERNAPSTKNAGYVCDHLNSETLPPVAAYVKKGDGHLAAYYRRTDVQRALEAVGACETVEGHAERMFAIEADPSLAPPKTKDQIAKEEREAKHQAAHAVADKERAYRLALYKQLRQRASTGALGLSSLREFIKAASDEYDLNACLHDLYECDVKTDLDTFIDTADAHALQVLLIDLILGHRLELHWYNVGDADQDAEFAPVVAMARHEGIDVEAVRADIFTPVPEATAAAEQPDAGIGSATVRYRNPNDPAQAWTGRGRQPKWVSEWVQNGKSLDALKVSTAPPNGQAKPAGTRPVPTSNSMFSTSQAA